MLPVNIAIVDDHTMFRKGLSAILQEEGEYNICIEAQNGRDFIDKLSLAKKLPDVCLLDIRMPVMNGYDTIKELKKKWPKLKVLVLSSYNDDYAVVNMLRNGASGYVFKDDNPDNLILAIKHIIENGYYHVKSIKEYYSSINEMPSLTDSEYKFLSLCCEELTYEQIGSRMNLSVRTIEKYREGLFKKLSVKNRTGLVMFAVKNGYV